MRQKPGTPQGAVISPLLANIYLHYVYDLWVHAWRRRHASGDMIVVRYADDTIAGWRFQQMCSHYLVEPVACTPASEWEKGQVENQAGTIRQRFFAPRVRANSYEELNAWLLDRCVAWARAQPHPEVRERTAWEMFEAERTAFVRFAGSWWRAVSTARCSTR